jgi:tetratricopeptide (TPR) repeat protein
MREEPDPAPEQRSESVVFGPYRLLREIGRGGMGVVHLAEVLPADAAEDGDISTEIGDVALRPPPGTRVAVKTFHSHLVDSKEFARRFRREARTGAAIHHPNVVSTYEAGTAKLRGVATSYLAMEYVEGQTLRDLIRELGQVPPTFAAALARQVAGGLAAIHAAGATHRDLKPENVIITSDHRVKLMDLGVAKLREASIRLSMTGQFIGSVHYASPEQFRTPDAVDHRTDLYALGVLLYEMLAGENPFFHADIRVVLRRTVSEMPRRLALAVPDTPRHLDQLVWSLIQKDAADRVQTAAEAAEALEHGEESAWWTSSGGALWAQSGERLARRMAVPRDARLAGRDAEMAELRRLFDLAAAGERQTLFLEGEAGVGKTRLLDEFAASLAEEGRAFHFVFGTCAPDGTGRPLHAFTEALHAALDPRDTAGSLARLLPADAPVAAFDGFLRGAPGAASLAEDQLRTLFAASFRALAAEKPLLVVADDLHRASESTRTLLSYVARDDRTARVLLVAAFRPPDEGQPLHRLVHEAREPNVRHMTLPRLSAKEVGALLRDLLRSERLVQEIAFPLLEKTEGNPFFVLEVIRSLQRDRVLLRKDDGAWTLAGTKVEIHVPDTVKDLLLANLAHIADEDRDLLDVAAVMGMEFDPDVLAEVSGVPKLPLLKRLSQLERKHRLVRSAGRRCRFDHPHLQETLYLGLMQGLREEYHAQVAECAERRATSSRAPEQVDAAAAFEIARHFVHAGRIERASPWIAPALRFAAQSYRVDEGVTVASRFLDAAEETGASVAPETRIDVLIALVGFHEHEGRREEERRRLDLAAAETAAVRDTRLLRRVRDLRLTFHFHVGDYAAAADACRDAFEDSAATGDKEGALAALGNLACALRSLGRFDEAAAHLERALAEFLPEGSGVRRCLLIGSLGLVDLHRGRTRAAQRRFLEARAVAVRFGIPEPGRLAPARPPDDGLREQFVGLSRALGRYAESRIDAERMLLLDTSLPRRLGEAAALLELGLLATLLEMTTEARACLLGSLAAARDASDARFEAAVLHALGENALQADDLDMARSDFARALELRRRIGYRPGTCESLLALGQLAAIRGELADARPLFDEASELAPALQMPAIAALARASRALLYAREGRRDAARAELEQARIVLADAGPLSVSSRAEGLYFAALAARALGDEDACRAHMQAAWRTIRAIADRLPPSEREAFLTGSSPNREITAAVGGATG